MTNSKVFTICIAALIAMLSLLGCDGCKGKKTGNPDKIVDVSLLQQWFPNAGYAGELFAVYETGKENGLNIKLQAGSEELSPIKMVLSGKYDFGVAGADEVLEANAKEQNLVVVGVINYKSLGCFLTKADANIVTPKEFANHKIGVQNGTSVYLMYKALMKKNNIDSTLLKEIEAPWDLATFITGAYDVRPAFYNDEPVTLDQKGIKYNVIKPNEWGVNFVGTVYFARKDFVDKNPEIVQKFVNSLCKGWELATADPKKSIDYLVKYDGKNIDSTRELNSLLKGLEYYKGENNKTLYSSKENWDAMANTLSSFGLLPKYSFSQSVNYDFVTWYHSKVKK
ncbi:MAG TPA: ABC transporter substrate-binding protein [Saprospiraceae bacterium]|nr:ABC transporter substrate-binding protein [Saprospiraceae bacterium]